MRWLAPASTVAWLVWAAGLLAVLIPRTVSLTGLRLAAPTVLAVAVWAAGRDGRGALDVLAVSWSVLVVVTALAPTTGEVFVNGSSYGDELPHAPAGADAAAARSRAAGVGRHRRRSCPRPGPPGRPRLGLGGAWSWCSVQASAQAAPVPCTGSRGAGWCSCRPASCCTTFRRWSTPCSSRGRRSPGWAPRSTVRRPTAARCWT